EERIARDLLAAFDRLQQERVVGVLGNLQESRDRRQHVGDDFLVDRHERPALRQVLELIETRQMHHTLRSIAALITPGTGGWPVPHSNFSSAWAMSIHRASSVRQ